jgi:hypothetical protein
MTRQNRFLHMVNLNLLVTGLAVNVLKKECDQFSVADRFDISVPLRLYSVSIQGTFCMACTIGNKAVLQNNYCICSKGFWWKCIMQGIAIFPGFVIWCCSNSNSVLATRSSPILRCLIRSSRSRSLAQIVKFLTCVQEIPCLNLSKDWRLSWFSWVAPSNQFLAWPSQCKHSLNIVPCNSI